ncbi:M28 family peptidase [Pleomorphovibrio marinus]|uniref:M28 family peptidase n=1 Tax=Pleomorphovibrio marinus TaxID=2164132 RepID=UPI000E0A14A9|nr:M28 family peptidase [Pleomorphovibrio marinus]
MRTAKSIIIFFLLWASYEINAQQLSTDQSLKDLEYLSSPKLEGRKPLSKGSQLAQDHIRARFRELGLGSQFQDFTQPFSLPSSISKKEGKAKNIVGFVPGSELDRIIIVMAHYDHIGVKDGEIYHGADDNASGVAGLLSLAAHYAKHRPLHSMVFAALDAEEMGLLGAKALLEDFPFSQDQIALVVNMDMIGRSDNDRLYAVGSRHYPHLLPLLEEVSKTAPIELFIGNDGGFGKKDWSKASDHAPFHAEGIPFLYFGVDDHEDYHRPSDTFENIDQAFFLKAIDTIFRVMEKFDSSQL